MKKISIVAHRGGGALRPENSLSAFAHAVQLGADEVECDVHMMADGRIVVFHDFDLLQLTGESERINAIDDARRQNLRLNGADEPPPLLEELAALLAPTTTKLHIEIKAEENDGRARITAEKSCAILRVHGLLERTSAISFEPTSLVPFIEAGVPSGPCIDAPDSILPADWPDQIRQWREAGYRDLSLNGNHSPLKFVHSMKQAGFTVGVWTINGPARLSYWLRQDVDYITTDQPDLALALRSELT